MSSYWSPSGSASVVIQTFSAMINFLILLLLRAVLIHLWKTSSSEGALRAVVYHSITSLLPWMPRVIGSSFMSAVWAALDEAIGYTALYNNPDHCDHYDDKVNEKRGQLFGCMMGLFLLLFLMCWHFKLWTMRGDHSYGPDATIHQYLIQVVFGCLSTMSGKALYFTFYLITDGLTPNLSDYDSVSAVYVPIVVQQLLQTVFTAWLMGSALPRMRRGVKNMAQMAQVEALAYVLIYWWAFSFVNALWWMYTQTIASNRILSGESISDLGFFLWWLSLAALLGLVFAVGFFVVGPPSFGPS